MMHNFIRLFIPACCLIIFGFDANSQKSSKDSLPEKSYFKLDMNYLNEVVYNGRNDSTRYPYITPTIGYYHKSGFYITGALSYLALANTGKIDLFTFDAGYEYEINNFLSGSIYAEKYFYTASSNSIINDFKGYLGASFKTDLQLVQIGTEAAITFATKKDYSTNLSLGHLFAIEQKDYKLTLNPSFAWNFSTLNYYEGSINKNFSKRQIANNRTILNISETTTASKNGLTYMDMELYLPISVESKNWSFYCTPYYCLPKNPISTNTSATITLRNGNVIKQQFDSTPWSERNLNPIFYIEAGLTYSF